MGLQLDDVISHFFRKSDDCLGMRGSVENFGRESRMVSRSRDLVVCTRGSYARGLSVLERSLSGPMAPGFLSGPAAKGRHIRHVLCSLL